ESVVRVPDRAPPQTRHAAWRHLPIHEQIRNVVRNVLRALDRRFVHALLYHRGLERCAGDKRLADDAVLPGERVAVRTEAGADGVKRPRTIKSAAHIVLACPD